MNFNIIMKDSLMENLHGVIQLVREIPDLDMSTELYSMKIKEICNKLQLVKNALLELYSELFQHIGTIKILFVSLQLIYDLCIKFNVSDNTQNTELASLLKQAFKLNFDLQSKLLESLNEFNSSFYDSNASIIGELCVRMSNCSVSAENLDMRASLPVWKSLAAITTTYCGTLLNNSQDSVFVDISQNYRTAFNFRMDQLKAKLTENVKDGGKDYEKEGKMAAFLLKCFMKFLVVYQAKLQECESLFEEAIQILVGTIEMKAVIHKLDGPHHASLLQYFGDTIFYGCEVIMSILIDSADSDSILTRISATPAFPHCILISVILRCLLKRNEPEISSSWIHRGVIQSAVNVICTIGENADFRGPPSPSLYNQGYHHLLVAVCSFVCVHHTNDVQEVESQLWLCLLTEKSMHSWIFVSDVLVFIARYGPMSFVIDYCAFLFTLINRFIESQHCNSHSVANVLRYGHLRTRFLKMLPQADRTKLLLSQKNSIVTWCFNSWDRHDDDDLRACGLCLSQTLESFVTQLRASVAVDNAVMMRTMLCLLLMDRLEAAGLSVSSVSGGEVASIALIFSELVQSFSSADSGTNYDELVTLAQHFRLRFAQSSNIVLKDWSPDPKRLRSDPLEDLLSKLQQAATEIVTIVSQESLHSLSTNQNHLLTSVIDQLTSLIRPIM